MNKSQFAFLILLITFWTHLTYSQICDSCICGTTSFTGETTSPGTFFGGRYKPHRSDIGGAPSNRDRFPIIIVFISFKDEPGDSTTTNFDSWPAGKPPNYLDSLIDTTRISGTNWWDAYNGYQIADYWHEFSRGKMHVTGKAFHFKLGQTIDWYESNGGVAKVNKDIYDSLKNKIDDWLVYDKWTYNSEGNFTWDEDNLVDMIYVVYRQRRQFLFDGITAWGLAFLGPCQSSSNNEYTVSQNPLVKIRTLADPDPLGSGLKIHAGDTSRYSRQRFIDLVTHEHGHYLFEFSHKIYMKMSYGGGYSNGWEFSLSPWEVIKLNYIIPRIVNYSNNQYLLSDYSSRYGNAGDTGEVLQIPISSNGTEFFLIANRRKVSQWDRRVGGDTLANDRWQFLKSINEDYGKGLYIYHIKDGYEFDKNEAYGNDIDLECADGLWNYIYANLQRKRLYDQQPVNVYKKDSVSYNNDNPDPSITGYVSGRDEMSNALSFTPGSPDNFNTEPISRGTHTLYTNDEDYWYSLASIGDRWDAWNVGYNEIFSSYSSPNTKNINNDSTGIFIWYQSLELSTNTATLKIYKVGQNGLSEDSILHLTPPSRPMGVKIESYVSLYHCYPKIVWNHNLEPDMIRTGNVKRYKIYKATESDVYHVPTNYSLLTTVDASVSSKPSFIDLSVYKHDCSPPGTEEITKYPVRYYVKAVDKYDDESVPSDFAKTIGVTNGASDPIDPDNINSGIAPKQYSLKQNYPNPFNPATNIQYELPVDNFVKLIVYDILGKEVITIVNEFKNAGSYIVSFNGANISSGIYYCKINAGKFWDIKKMLLIK